MNRTPCPVCDFPLATEADSGAYARSAFGDDDDLRVLGVVCCWFKAEWSEFGSDHRGPAIDWRARALEAEESLDAAVTLRRGIELDLGGKVAALEMALRAADYRLGEVSNYLGPFDHPLMFRSLSETITQVRAALAEVTP